MKKKIVIGLQLFLASGIFWSCETEIEFKSKTIEPKLVLNSLVSQDSILYCGLYQTAHAAYGDFQILPISNALIVISENNQPYDTLSYLSDGRYIGTKTANLNNIYKFVASVANFPQASATTELLPNNEVLSVDSVGLRLNEYGSSNVILRARMSFQPEMTSYYRLRAIGHSEWYDEYSDSVIVQDYTLYLPNDENLPGIEFYTWRDNTLYYSDKIRTSQEAIIEIPLESYFFESSSHLTRIDFYIEQLSTDYFLYEKSRYLFDNGDDFALFSQPVQIFNNIEGGVGILGTAKKFVFSMDLNRK
ncbi:MAG: DUF4249 domain-containing protein [Salinivirgaceae bacterium]|nr:DUF4249 domain-containing protein [Salinivirgaceae bacterium]